MKVGTGVAGVSIEVGAFPLEELPPLPVHGEIRPIAELRTWGIVWLLNRIAFHPRGYAICLALDDQDDVVGWALLGDGGETLPYTDPNEDELLARVLGLLEPRAA